ncbi:MAG: glycosyltransferase family 2 protein [bacterium]
MSKVFIIIVNYNGQKYLPALLASLARQTLKAAIILVDNASTDNSVVFVGKDYPEVKIIKNQKNLGFAQGNNIGIEQAIKEGADYIALLNQDTRVEPDWLAKLVDKMEEDKSIASCQPTILMWPDKNKINSLGNEIHFLGFGFTKGNGQALDFSANRQTKITYCSGAACLLSVEALKKVGLFDEKLFMYQEDLDLGWRFRLAGYLNVLVPEAVVYHEYHFSQAKYKYYYMERNRHWVNLKNYRFWSLIIIFPAIIIMELGLWFFAVVKGWWPEKIKGYVSLIKNLPYILKQRKQVQQLRKVSDRKIVKLFVSRIWYQEISNPLLNYLGNPLMAVYWSIARWLVI